MSATDELRKMLDERGVKHYDGTELTLWLKDEHGYRASADELTSGRLSVHIWCGTPEQAITATLGAGTCEKVRVHMPIEDEMHCSECGRFLGFAGDIGAPPYNYCPNCGRKVVDE